MSNVAEFVALFGHDVDRERFASQDWLDFDDLETGVDALHDVAGVGFEFVLALLDFLLEIQILVCCDAEDFAFGEERVVSAARVVDVAEHVLAGDALAAAAVGAGAGEHFAQFDASEGSDDDFAAAAGLDVALEVELADEFHGAKADDEGLGCFERFVREPVFFGEQFLDIRLELWERDDGQRGLRSSGGSRTSDAWAREDAIVSRLSPPAISGIEVTFGRGNMELESETGLQFSANCYHGSMRATRTQGGGDDHAEATRVAMKRQSTSRDGGRGGDRCASAAADYASVLDALWVQRHNVERLNAVQMQGAPGLSLIATSELLRELGDPHKSLRCVHVAGSKGKGSICEMIASSLRGCGYTVGVYTSPHLVDLRERIRVLYDAVDEMIPREAFAAHGARVLDAASVVDGRRAALGEPGLSAFELLTALAFVHCAELAVDVAVIEVGLGGTFDATNVIEPVACALGRVQLEHAHVLGPTLADIALHKAGIMKAGVPVFSVPQLPEVEQVFASRAAAVGAELKFLGKDIEFTHRFQNAGENAPRRGPHHKLAMMLPTRTYEHVAVPLPGEHQAANCALALAVLEALSQQGFSLPEGSVVEGLSRTPAVGRTEFIHDEPRVMIDGAHTPEAMQALMRTLGAQLKFDSLVVVFGCNDDKDAAGMLQALSLGADKVILTKVCDSARAIEPKELLRTFVEVNQHPHLAMAAPCVKDAINLASKSVGRNDLILVTGSFAIAGEAKKLFLEKFPGKCVGGVEVKP